MDQIKSGNRKTYSKLNNAGISLVELLVTIAILGVIGGVIIGFLQTGAKSYQATDKEVDMQYDAQVLLNQMGDYVMDANSGFKQEGNQVHIYSSRNNAMEIETLSWEPQEKKLYYEKKQKVNETESTVVEKSLLAENVSEFSMDLSKAVSERKVDAKLTLQKEKKSYEASTTWNLRNAAAVSTDEGGSGWEGPDPVVEQVKVFGSKTELWPGEEQLFYARVLGYFLPSQQVVWFIEGETASRDTYIDEGGILHIGADETAAELKVAAQSSEDPTVTGRLTVKIHDEKIRITPEESWLGAGGNVFDPDSYGTGTVELSAKLLNSDDMMLTDIVWNCDKAVYQTDMAGQTSDLKKTITLDAKEKYGKITIQVTAKDGAGNTVTSNKAVLHVVRIETNQTKQNIESCFKPTAGTRMYVYGLEGVAKEDLQMAASFEDIRNNTKNCRFYLYDSREVLYFNNQQGIVTNSDGSYGGFVFFYPEFSIWDRLFPNPQSRYTCIGVYRAGELQKKTDDAGEACHFGFSVTKVRLEEK